MNNQMMIVAFTVLILLYVFWELRKATAKIHCRYVDVTKQVVDKYVSATANSVIFDKNKDFRIVTSCVKLETKMILLVIPVPQKTIDYRYGNKNPIDPTTGEPKVMSPEAEAAIDEGKAWIAYNQGQAQGMAAPNKKLGGLAQYMPIIAIGLVAIVAIYFWNQNKGMQADMKVIKLALQNLLNQGGK